MSEQRWFAGLPVVGQRALEGEDEERLAQLASEIWWESAGSFGVLLIAVVFVVVASLVNLAYGWFGFLVFALTSGLLRFLPQRRFFGIRTLAGLRRDLRERTVYVCANQDTYAEVLAHSHVVWTRHGLPLEPPVVAHGTATALLPDHAAMAANFVRPYEDGADVLFHQRALTVEELKELESYAPRPAFAVIALASIGLAGAFATFGLALTGRLVSLLPTAVFAVAAAWAGRAAWRAYRNRKVIAADVEAGCVVIARRQEATGELGRAQEILPFSRIIWTEGGETAPWRTMLRTAPPPGCGHTPQ